jgi:acetyl-CoA C-acetyltransferase
MKRKLGRGVAIVGAGMSNFGVFKEKIQRDLFVEAFTEMASSVEKGLQVADIDALYVGNFSSDLFEGQGHLGPILADWIGLTPKPATRTEGACASGALAFREGIFAIASGFYDVVLVGGVEKMTDLPTERVTETLSIATDMAYEGRAGFTFPGVFGATATAYFEKYGATPDHLMQVAIKNHHNARLNPKAQFNTSIRDIMNGRIEGAKKRGEPAPTWKDEMDFLRDPRANPVVAWPMRLYDCSPISDGASCMLLVAEEIAENFTADPIHVIGIGQGSGRALHTKEDLTHFEATRYAAREAYEMSGLKPEDIQIAEVHDCFTIAEICHIEDLGFFRPGEGYKAVEEGLTERTGPKPINTSGGLKCKGHPVGATGIAQLYEIWKQLRGEAGERQVPIKDLRIGAAHNLGGTGGTCTFNILERR